MLAGIPLSVTTRSEGSYRSVDDLPDTLKGLQLRGRCCERTTGWNVPVGHGRTCQDLLVDPLLRSPSVFSLDRPDTTKTRRAPIILHLPKCSNPLLADFVVLTRGHRSITGKHRLPSDRDMAREYRLNIYSYSPSRGLNRDTEMNFSDCLSLPSS